MNKKLLFTIIVLLVIGGGVIFFVFFRDSNNQSEIPDELLDNVATTTDENGQNNSDTMQDQRSTRERLIELNPAYANDVDRDGLDASMEAQYGTSDDAFDTDGDGLSDPDEINIWKTDPLKIDTDGDGYGDAFEIANGYNPNGEGTLPEQEMQLGDMPANAQEFQDSTNTSTQQ